MNIAGAGTSAKDGISAPTIQGDVIMRSSILLGTLLLVIGLTGCSGDSSPDGPPTNFSKVDLDFTSGSEVFLLGVFSVPDGEAAAADNAEFTLTAGGAPAKALRVGQKPSMPPVGYDAQAWADRMAFDAQQRAGIDRLVADVRAGRRTLHPAATRQSSACSPACSGNDMCWKGTCTNTPTVAMWDGSTRSDVATTVVAVTTGSFKVNVLLDDDDAGAEVAATAAGNAFAAAAVKALGFLGQTGHTSPLDRDGDGHMTVVFSSKLETLGDVVGFFDFRDFLPETDADATQNEADLLWARVPGTDTRASCQATSGCPTSVITPEVAIGTLAHEYTHLVNFAVRVYFRDANPADNEVLWLDEGMAHLMEDLTGYNASNIGAAAVALSEWPSATFASPADSVAQRGQAYLLLRHIIDAKGRASGMSNAAAAASSYPLHKTLLTDSARGYQHAIFSEVGADGLWQWLLATYTTGNVNVTESAAKSYDYLALSTEPTGQPSGFSPFHTFVDARGTDVILDGPKLGDGSVDELTDFTTPYTNTQAVSGSYLFLVSGLKTGTTTISISTPTSVKFKLQAVRVK
jgi:hypothetical protein